MVGIWKPGNIHGYFISESHTDIRLVFALKSLVGDGFRAQAAGIQTYLWNSTFCNHVR